MLKQPQRLRAVALALPLALLAGTTLLTAGCAVTRNQETVGAYVDDASITTGIKARYVDDPTVGALSIKVETLNGVVQLSGFAKSATEKNQAETIARGVKGVREVHNNIVVRP